MRFPLLIVVALAFFPAGCAYRYGACSLYRPDVQTVHVPVITSGSFRRDLGERLTEAVVKEIQTNSPYNVVSEAKADSVLTVRLDFDNKKILAENAYDEGRNLETTMQCHMTWRGRDGNLLTQSSMPLDSTVVAIAQSTAFVPEAGQSLATAHQKVIDRLATEIVSQMEAGW